MAETTTEESRTTDGPPTMETFSYAASRALYERAAKVIPCGVYGHYSPAPLIPVDAYPFFSVRAQGAHFWDVDGNEFIDYMCAYGPMVLGYGWPKVDAAVLRQMKDGNTVTCAPKLMVELAEYMVELVTGMDWAYFAKNGGDVTNYAIMTARAATGRKKIIAIQGGYHGVAPWMQSLGHPGVIEEDQQHIIRIPWNDLSALERVLTDHGDDVAGFIATPYHHPVFAESELPAEGYWKSVQEMLHKKGALLIIDDVRTGFRLHLNGSHVYFDFEPDLVCFCKALANGYPISALMGVEPLKNAAAKVFYTGSYWFSAGPMAAALACLDELKRLDAPNRMMASGQKLCDGLVDAAKAHGYDLKVTGVTSMPYLSLPGDDGLMLFQEVCGEATRRGAFMTSHHNWFLSTAHTNPDIRRTIEIFDDALKAVKQRRAS